MDDLIRWDEITHERDFPRGSAAFGVEPSQIIKELMRSARNGMKRHSSAEMIKHSDEANENTCINIFRFKNCIVIPARTHNEHQHLLEYTVHVFNSGRYFLQNDIMENVKMLIIRCADLKIAIRFLRARRQTFYARYK